MCYPSDGPAAFWRDAHPKARKPHRCDECRAEIAPGERYHYVAAKWDGVFAANYECSPCEALRMRIHEIEMARGCGWTDAWVPLEYMAEALREGDYGLVQGRLAFWRRYLRADRARRKKALR